MPKGIKAHPLVEAVIFDLREESEKLSDTAEPIMIKAAADEAGTLISELELDIGFDEGDPQFTNWVNTKADDFSFQVNNTTITRLKDTLEEGVNSGEGLAKLTDRVNEEFKFAKTYRAERIARTEMNRASAKGRLDTLKKSRVIEGKEWSAALDERTRPSHIVTDGQEVKTNEYFTLGSGVKTEGPGQSGVAAEDINCRCLVTPVVDLN